MPILLLPCRFGQYYHRRQLVVVGLGFDCRIVCANLVRNLREVAEFDFFNSLVVTRTEAFLLSVAFARLA